MSPRISIRTLQWSVVAVRYAALDVDSVIHKK